ncbi:15136_t:CDS:1, partial [Racocetra persica]
NLSSIAGRIMRSASTACTGANKNYTIYFSDETIAGGNFSSVFDITTRQRSTPKTSGNFSANKRKFAQCIAS